MSVVINGIIDNPELCENIEYLFYACKLCDVKKILSAYLKEQNYNAEINIGVVNASINCTYDATLASMMTQIERAHAFLGAGYIMVHRAKRDVENIEKESAGPLAQWANDIAEKYTGKWVIKRGMHEIRFFKAINATALRPGGFTHGLLVNSEVIHTDKMDYPHSTHTIIDFSMQTDFEIVTEKEVISMLNEEKKAAIDDINSRYQVCVKNVHKISKDKCR